MRQPFFILLERLHDSSFDGLVWIRFLLFPDMSASNALYADELLHALTTLKSRKVQQCALQPGLTMLEKLNVSVGHIVMPAVSHELG